MEGLIRNLEQFSDEELKSLVLVNKELKLYSLRQLVLNRFGTIFWELKNPNLSEEEWYSFLLRMKITFDNVELAAKKGDIITLKIMASMKLFPTEYSIIEAIKNGHTDVLELLFQMKKVTLDKLYQLLNEIYSRYYDIDTKHQLKIFKWLADKGFIFDEKMTEVANIAIADKNFELLDWLIQKGVLPSESGANIAVRIRDLKLLNFLAERGVLPSDNLYGVLQLSGWEKGTSPNVDYLYQSLKKSDFELIEFAIRNGILPEPYTISSLIKDNSWKTLEWLFKKGIKINPNINDVNRAAYNNNFEMLNLLASQGILPTQSSANIALSYNHLEMLDWLANYNILPEVEGANWVVEQGNWKLLNWLESKGVLPDSRGAELAVKTKNWDMLNWLAEKNILPEVEVANWAAEEAEWDILDWLESKDILPDSRGADGAAKTGRLSVLKWLEEKDIFPSKNGGIIGANEALKHKDWKVLEWFEYMGYFPDNY